MLQSLHILQSIENDLLQEVKKYHKRMVYDQIPRYSKACLLIGQRGVGKTTLLLQHRSTTHHALYFSADSANIAKIGLFDFVYYTYQQHDIVHFYIDEIFKYTNRRQELKQLIDSMPKAHFYISGSSSLHLYSGLTDLARRIDITHVYPLSWREYLAIHHHIIIPIYTLKDIIHNHQKIQGKYGKHIKENQRNHYLEKGIYPFAADAHVASYTQRLQQLLQRIIIEDLPTIRQFKTTSLDKLQKIFSFLAQIPPSELSVHQLAKKIGLDNELVENTLYFLAQIGIVFLLPKHGSLSDKIRKQYKIILGNPNLYYAFTTKPKIGTIRESFFLHSISHITDKEISVPKQGDYIITTPEINLRLEIGGAGKTGKQLQPHTGYVIQDIIISSEKHIIPLWVFGLLR